MMLERHHAREKVCILKQMLNDIVQHEIFQTYILAKGIIIYVKQPPFFLLNNLFVEKRNAFLRTDEWKKQKNGRKKS